MTPIAMFLDLQDDMRKRRYDLVYRHSLDINHVDARFFRTVVKPWVSSSVKMDARYVPVYLKSLVELVDFSEMYRDLPCNLRITNYNLPQLMLKRALNVYVASLTVMDVSLTDMRQIENLRTLQALSVETCKYFDASLVDDLPHLRSVSLEGIAHLRGLRSLERLPQLTSLCIQDMYITDDILKGTLLPQVQYLNLAEARGDLLSVINACPNLKRLNLYQSSGVDASILYNLPRLDTIILSAHRQRDAWEKLLADSVIRPIWKP